MTDIQPDFSDLKNRIRASTQQVWDLAANTVEISDGTILDTSLFKELVAEIEAEDEDEDDTRVEGILPIHSAPYEGEDGG